MPINQGLYLDFSDIICPQIVKAKDIKTLKGSKSKKSKRNSEVKEKSQFSNLAQSNYEQDQKKHKKHFKSFKNLIGSDLYKTLTKLKVFMVGAGAIGCELLKNFAMLGIGTDTIGKIYVTDPDIIEVSNLSRQFLFREKHIRKPKSSTAAAAIKLMSPNINCLPLLEKVHNQTENIFNDNF